MADAILAQALLAARFRFAFGPLNCTLACRACPVVFCFERGELLPGSRGTWQLFFLKSLRGTSAQDEGPQPNI